MQVRSKEISLSFAASCYETSLEWSRRIDLIGRVTHKEWLHTFRHREQELAVVKAGEEGGGGRSQILFDHRRLVGYRKFPKITWSAKFAGSIAFSITRSFFPDLDHHLRAAPSWMGLYHESSTTPTSPLTLPAVNVYRLLRHLYAEIN